MIVAVWVAGQRHAKRLVADLCAMEVLKQILPAGSGEKRATLRTLVRKADRHRAQRQRLAP